MSSAWMVRVIRQGKVKAKVKQGPSKAHAPTQDNGVSILLSEPILSCLCTTRILDIY